MTDTNENKGCLLRTSPPPLQKRGLFPAVSRRVDRDASDIFRVKQASHLPSGKGRRRPSGETVPAFDVDDIERYCMDSPQAAGGANAAGKRQTRNKPLRNEITSVQTLLHPVLLLQAAFNGINHISGRIDGTDGIRRYLIKEILQRETDLLRCRK